MSVQGLLEPGNIDLAARPTVTNPDGSVSTVRSIGISEDGKEIVIPTVINGRVVSDEDAIAQYKKTGQHLGKFSDRSSADSFAQSLHEQEAARVGKQSQTKTDGPQIGEVRTVGQETRRWDGMAWRLVPRSFLGTEDFTGRMREYAKPVLKTMASDLASPVLHPIDTATGVVSSLAHPLSTLANLYGVGKAAVQGDPEAAGHVLSMVAAPKAADTALSGVNTAAHAVAETPYVRHALGAVGGAIGAKGVGLSPFLGMGVGRAASGVLQGPAEDVAAATDWLKNAIHGKPGETPSVLSATQKAELVKKGYSPETIQRIEESSRKAPAPEPSASPTSGSAAAIPSSESPVDALTRETPEQWRQRVQGKIDQSQISTPSTTTKTAASLPADLARLRRTYGAERIGQALNPQAPEMGMAAVRNAAPGPSALPDIAQESLLRDLQAGKTSDPGRHYRALSQALREYERNKGPANSPVAKQLYEQLKKYGFIKD